MGRIKCFSNVECQVCHIKGMLQVFYDSKGNPRYCRIRHYAGKGKFHYHKQDLEYIKQVLHSINQNNDHSGQKNIDLNLNILNHNNRNVRAGSLARLGHPLDVRKVTGSNPVRPTKKSLHAFYEVFNSFSFLWNL